MRLAFAFVRLSLVIGRECEEGEGSRSHERPTNALLRPNLSAATRTNTRAAAKGDGDPILVLTETAAARSPPRWSIRPVRSRRITAKGDA